MSFQKAPAKGPNEFLTWLDLVAFLKEVPGEARFFFLSLNKSEIKWLILSEWYVCQINGWLFF